jgi:hypothetical protein
MRCMRKCRRGGDVAEVVRRHLHANGSGFQRALPARHVTGRRYGDMNAAVGMALLTWGIQRPPRRVLAKLRRSIRTRIEPPCGLLKSALGPRALRTSQSHRCAHCALRLALQGGKGLHTRARVSEAGQLPRKAFLKLRDIMMALRARLSRARHVSYMGARAGVCEERAQRTCPWRKNVTILEF